MSRRPLPFILVAAALAASSAVVPAGAATVEGMALRDLVVKSPSVVRGTVVSSTSRWNEDRSLIVTDVRVEVQEVLKGRPVSEVTITEPGGQVGKLRVDVDGAAAFPAGREVVLFLNSDSEGRSHVTGLFQGRFDVTQDPRTGRKTVCGAAPPRSGAAAAGKPGVRPESAPEASSGPPVLLDDFLSGLKTLVRDVDAKGGK